VLCASAFRRGQTSGGGGFCDAKGVQKKSKLLTGGADKTIKKSKKREDVKRVVELGEIEQH